jgi:hypothetical protein
LKAIDLLLSLLELEKVENILSLPKSLEERIVLKLGTLWMELVAVERRLSPVGVAFAKSKVLAKKRFGDWGDVAEDAITKVLIN